MTTARTIGKPMAKEHSPLMRELLEHELNSLITEAARRLVESTTREQRIGLIEMLTLAGQGLVKFGAGTPTVTRP